MVSDINEIIPLLANHLQNHLSFTTYLIKENTIIGPSVYRRPSPFTVDIYIPKLCMCKYK